MERQKIKSTIETLTNVAVLLVAIAALCLFAINHVLKPQSPKLRAGLARGKTLGSVPKLDYKSSSHTLIIALNTNCSYCRDSLPFYRKLVEAKPQSSNALHIVALFPNKPEDVARYVQEKN